MKKHPLTMKQSFYSAKATLILGVNPKAGGYLQPND